MRRKTTEQFITEAQDVHGNKYNYSLVEYIGGHIKVKIICPIHGVFEQSPHNHLNGQGCSKCAGKFMDLEFFIERATELHNGKYDYSEVKYKNAHTKVPIICIKHGVFWQQPAGHLNGAGCSKCYHQSKKNLICGVGINDYEDSIKEDNKHIKSYRMWYNMINRCYSERELLRFPTYRGCTVCEEWMYFSNFKEWFNNPDNGYKEGYHIDKDILCKGSKVYSPETSCFVPQEINALFVKTNASRGEYPIGVQKIKSRFVASISLYKKSKQLGTFSTPEEAFEAYKTAKEKHIKNMADKYYSDGKITKKVRDAMHQYEVEITD